MIRKLYPLSVFLLILFSKSYAQFGSTDCSGFSFTYTSMDSRCASTGSIAVNASGGSGDYGFKVTGPVSTPITSSPTITGLAPGTYVLYVKDMANGCILTDSNVVVGGSYADPRFQLTKTDVSCAGASNGSISVSSLVDGRSPFTYTIIAPSPFGVGTTNSTGSFSSLLPGQYFIQLKDSCGGIQTRSVIIQGYDWWIDSHSESKITCTKLSVTISLIDNQGNNNASGSAFNAFKYGVVNSPGDTSWFNNKTFSFTKSPLRTHTFVVKDGCGLVKSYSWTNPQPNLSNSINLSAYACNTFTANVNSPSNLTNPQYCLKQGATTISCNSTGQFTNVPYGSYCIEMTDACYDTLITRCFSTSAPKPSVSSSVNISNKQCSTFTATVTGQSNLFNPQYCLYNNANVLITCNTTGVFNNINYGSYTIRTTSSAPCYDTTIVRSFTVTTPVPSVGASVSLSSQTCSSFTASITGQSNLFNPQYCIYDNLNNLIICNATGIFTGLAYGNYCIRVTSATPCYDTVITRCFSATAPQPAAGNPVISNQGCTTFTVTIPSVSNISMPQYCLYDNGNNLVTCNSTGVFNNVLYGSYCIIVTSNDPAPVCPVSPVTKCFTASRPVPSVNSWVSISNKDCNSFTADITGETNLFNPQYCLYDNSDNLISCNNTGKFNNVSYGSYCIRISDACGDTTINRCFTVTQPSMSMNVDAAAACTLNTTDIEVVPSGGFSPYTAKIFNPANVVIATKNFSSGSYTFTGIPALGPGLQYKVTITDQCNRTDTTFVTPLPSVFDRNINVSGKCPSAGQNNGSGDLTVALTSNLGLYSPVIIKQNGSPVSISFNNSNYVSPTYKTFTFSDLEPATYVVEYNISSCSKKVHDTVTVAAYQYPNLANSAAYQCDNNNFSVNTVATGGVAPYAYEIIGSNPSGPSIVASPQASPIFDITNGVSYSLVRMRVVDGCGNATLNDVSVLPLGNLSISPNTFDCYFNDVTLTVDTVPNATYTWYKKTSDTDSIQVGTSQGYNMPYLLPSDTGIYVARTSVNNGCLTRLSYYHVDADCVVLPVNLLSFKGQWQDGSVQLRWDVTGEYEMDSYVVQRKTASGYGFVDIGRLKARNTPGQLSYHFNDPDPAPGLNEYRLRMEHQSGKSAVSQVVSVRIAGGSISLAPNPVSHVLNISIRATREHRYEIVIYGSGGAQVYRLLTGPVQSAVVPVPRTVSMTNGLYIVKVRDLDSDEVFTQKIIYQ